MAGLSLENIAALAPDQASLNAARKLLTPGVWSGLTQGGTGLAWAECQGSGAMPYRVVISDLDAASKCTCPSRKFPCKHILALMWMRAEATARFDAGSPPEWVMDWLRRRGESVADEAKSERDLGRESLFKSIALTTPQEEPEIDEKAEARATATRARVRKEREAAILAGLDDLDQWLADQVDAGLAGFSERAGKSCRLIAQRMVDAKAPGLAGRLESLPARLYALPEPARPRAAVEELGQLHLVAEAYRKQGALQSEMVADVRREVGWTQTRESLLADDSALRITGTWRVVGTLSEMQPDRLRRKETWLCREGCGDQPRFAVLIDFVPAAAGLARGPYFTGERLEGAVVYYPSPVPIRALVERVHAGSHGIADELELPDTRLQATMEEYKRALIAKPWLGDWPMAFRHARVRRSGERHFLCANENATVALPLMPGQWMSATPLTALDSMDGVALWNGSYLRLLIAQTELGRWVGE